MIVLWLAGGASQLDTFDPHPGSEIAPEVEAIDTAVKGEQWVMMEEVFFHDEAHRGVPLMPKPQRVEIGKGE